MASVSSPWQLKSQLLSKHIRKSSTQSQKPLRPSASFVLPQYDQPEQNKTTEPIFESSTHSERSIVVEEYPKQKSGNSSVHHTARRKPAASIQKPSKNVMHQQEQQIPKKPFQDLINLFKHCRTNSNITLDPTDQNRIGSSVRSSLRKHSRNISLTSNIGSAKKVDKTIQAVNISRCDVSLKIPSMQDNNHSTTPMQRLIQNSRKQKENYLKKLAAISSALQQKQQSFNQQPRQSEVCFRHNDSQTRISQNKLHQPAARQPVQNSHNPSTINNIVLISPSVSRSGKQSIKNILSQIVGKAQQPTSKKHCCVKKPQASNITEVRKSSCKILTKNITGKEGNTSRRGQSKSQHNITASCDQENVYLVKPKNKAKDKKVSRVNQTSKSGAVLNKSDIDNMGETMKLLLKKEKLERELMEININLVDRRKQRCTLDRGS